jgi:hypothetical protein
MPKRISSKLEDPNQIAAADVRASTEDVLETEQGAISRIMAEMGRKGGRIGRKRSMKTMSPTARRKIARKVAMTL